MTAPTLWDAVPLPAHPTVTQLEGAAALAPHVQRVRALVLEAVERAGRKGRTPREVADATGIELVTCRARLTEAHQAGHLIRTERRLDRQYLYVTPSAWEPWMGSTPSQPHRGRR